MRITCEKCHAMYCIAERVIGSAGRMVKCAKCAHTWMVTPPAYHSELRAEPPSYNNLKVNLPVLFKPALPNYFKLIPILFIFFISILTLAFFSEALIIYQPFKTIYQQFGVYDSKGLSLNDFTLKILPQETSSNQEDILNKDSESFNLHLPEATIEAIAPNRWDILIKGSIKNISNQDKITPDIRYLLLDKNKEIVFRYINHSNKQVIKAGETVPISTKITNVKNNAEYLQLDIGNKLEILLR